jgi:hypothetical protein
MHGSIRRQRRVAAPACVTQQVVLADWQSLTVVVESIHERQAATHWASNCPLIGEKDDRVHAAGATLLVRHEGVRVGRDRGACEARGERAVGRLAASRRPAAPHAVAVRSVLLDPELCRQRVRKSRVAKVRRVAVWVWWVDEPVDVRLACEEPAALAGLLAQHNAGALQVMLHCLDLHHRL